MNFANAQLKNKTGRIANPRSCLLFVLFAFMMTGITAFSKTMQTGERIEYVTNNIPPAWNETSGAYIEISGSYSVIGDASVVLRIADESRPLVLAWGSNDGFQMGGLPRDVAELEGERSREPQTVAWRLIIRGLKRNAQHLKLETQNSGAWQVVLEKDMVVRRLQEWISEKDGVLIFGLAGEVELNSAHVRMVQGSTLFILK